MQPGKGMLVSVAISRSIIYGGVIYKRTLNQVRAIALKEGLDINGEWITPHFVIFVQERMRHDFDVQYYIIRISPGVWHFMAVSQ